MRLAGAAAPARVAAAVPPASGAVVMGTGIVSIGLSVDGYETLSRALLALDAAVWVLLGALLARRLAREPERVRADARSPAALTGVAGTAVLGARVALLGWEEVGGALLALALCLWLALLPRVFRHWRTPTVGVSFVLAVSTESLSVLAAVLAVLERSEWLEVAALVALALGVVAYAFVLARFDLRQLVAGHGDHWVAGGALAIATLACGRAAQAAQALGPLHGLAGGLGTASLAIWAAAFAWLPALLVAEVAAPRLGYDVRRWSTVFPVGMYAACSFVVGDVERIGGLVDFARVWVWIAFALWLVVFAALLHRGLVLWRGEAAAQRPSARTPA